MATVEVGVHPLVTLRLHLYAQRGNARQKTLREAPVMGEMKFPPDFVLRPMNTCSTQVVSNAETAALRTPPTRFQQTLTYRMQYALLLKSAFRGL